MDKKIKTIHDVFKLGSRAVINNQDYQLEEIMISCREFLLAVLETEVVGRNERRRKRNYSAAHFPPNIRPLEEFDPEELDSGITQAQLDKLKGLS